MLRHLGFVARANLVVLLARGVLGLFLQLGNVVLGGTTVLVSVGFDLVPGKIVLVVCSWRIWFGVLVLVLVLEYVMCYRLAVLEQWCLC